MIIRKLKICADGKQSDFVFSEKMTLITSNGKNKVGKTTLVRALLFALGFAVPGTSGFRFTKNKKFEVTLSDSKEELVLERTGSQVVCHSSVSETDYFTLPYDLSALNKRVWNIESEYLSQNILTTFFFDQDKGWTLLNRGKPIGGIRFNIERFISALSCEEQEERLSKIAYLDRQIKKYSFALKMSNYRQDILEGASGFEQQIDIARDQEKMQKLNVQAAFFQRQINSLRKAQRDNKHFVEYVEKMKLRVRLEDGSILVVRAEDIEDYADSSQYLESQILDFKNQLDAVKKQIQALGFGADVVLTLFDKDKETESVIMKLDKQISAMEINPVQVEKALGYLHAEKRSLIDMQNESMHSSEAYRWVEDCIERYCKKLGVSELISPSQESILTNDIQSKSGTDYQQLVFAYRLAYAKAVEHFVNIRMPLIIDSPRGREMSDENFRSCMKLLADEFSEWQIVIASYKDDGIPYDEIININQFLMEGAVKCDTDQLQIPFGMETSNPESIMK